MSLKSNKNCIEGFIFIVFLIGEFWVIYSAFLVYKNMNIGYESDEYNLFHAAYILAITHGCIIIVWSLLGFISSWKRFNTLFAIFNIGIFIHLLIQLALLGISVAIYVNVQDYQNDTTCQVQELLIEMKSRDDFANSILCQDKCKCNFNGSNEEATAYHIKNYSSTEGQSKIQDCPSFVEDLPLKILRRYSDLLGQFENEFQCSGICNSNKFYLFSDVNNGMPHKECRIEVIDYVEMHSLIILIAASISSFVFLIGSISACCLYSKKIAGQSVYHRREGGYENNGQQ